VRQANSVSCGLAETICITCELDFRVDVLSGPFEVVRLDDSPAALQTSLGRARAFANGDITQKTVIRIKSLRAQEVKK
jgi:hypothetical protein